MSILKIADQIARIIANPTSNLTGAVLLLAMGVLLLLILAVGALMTVLPGADEDEDDEDDEDLEHPPARTVPEPAAPPNARSRRPLPAWAKVGLPAALAFVALVSGWYTTGRPESCGSCHAVAPSAKSWKTGDHATVGCVACHESGGIGIPAALVTRLTDVAAAATGRDTVAGARRPVPSSRCERCHARVLRETVTARDIKVSHREFLQRGYECVRCHAGTGHSAGDGAERAISMNQCIDCHNGKTAASACPTCHVADPGVAIRVSRSVYPKADIPIPAGCRGCHETASCTKCHGVEMPHPKGFETGKGHAKLAVFERKELCWRCHTEQDCRACHKGDFATSHPAGWKRTHPSGVPLDGRNACACHSTPDFCGLCHETGKR